jgi:anti-anti-sigma factor
MEIVTTQYKQCDMAKVTGRIDSFTAPQLSNTLHSFTDQGRYKILLDLTDVSYVSSAGLRVMIDIQKICKQSNRGQVVLVCVPQRIYETLELAGFVPLFKFYDDVSAAVDGF